MSDLFKSFRLNKNTVYYMVSLLMVLDKSGRHHHSLYCKVLICNSQEFHLPDNYPLIKNCQLWGSTLIVFTFVFHNRYLPMVCSCACKLLYVLAFRANSLPVLVQIPPVDGKTQWYHISCVVVLFHLKSEKYMFVYLLIHIN